MLHRVMVLVLCAALLAGGLTLGAPAGTWADGETSGPGQDPPPRPRIAGPNFTYASAVSFLYLQSLLLTR